MREKAQAQKYVNNFRRRMTRYLRPDIGMRVIVHPAAAGGGVVEVEFSEVVENDDEFRPPAPTVNDVLKAIPQNAFGGNLDGFRFEGTNIVMEPGRVLLIKGTDDRGEWDQKAAERDTRRILAGGSQ